MKRTPRKLKPVLGPWIDKLFALRTQRLELERKVEAMKGSEQGLRAQILEKLQELALTKASGAKATFSFRPKPVGTVTDWKALERWAVEHDALDLFQRRLHQGAWLERMEAGQPIAGVERGSVLDVSLTKKGSV